MSRTFLEVFKGFKKNCFTCLGKGAALPLSMSLLLDIYGWLPRGWSRCALWQPRGLADTTAPLHGG